MGYIVNLVLDGRLAVVVGGGEVASRKVEDLLAANARVTVIAPEPCEAVTAMADRGRIQAHWRPYQPGDLDDAAIVIASTDDETVNAQVSRDAVERHLPVNVVDRPALCTFTVPATVSRGDLKLAIATEGRCPALSSILREEMEGRYGDEYGPLVDLFADLRLKMIGLRWDGRKIRATLKQIYHDGVMDLLAAADPNPLETFLLAHLGESFPLH